MATGKPRTKCPGCGAEMGCIRAKFDSADMSTVLITRPFHLKQKAMRGPIKPGPITDEKLIEVMELAILRRANAHKALMNLSSHIVIALCEEVAANRLRQPKPTEGI